MQTGWEPLYLQTQLSDTTSAATVELVPGIYSIQSLGNAGFVETLEGIVVIDTGNPLQPDAVLGPLRRVSNTPVHTIIYTHGHADHAANALPLLEEAEQRGDQRPTIIGHRNIMQRMDRYAELYGLNDSINRLQFRLPEKHPGFPADNRFVRPDTLYEDTYVLHCGELSFHLYHANGETDDITWIYIPERKVIFSGDLFISSCPNIGNPFKIQRFDSEWAEALVQMADCKADILSPGHGGVVRGRERIKDALLTTAQALRYLHEEVVQRLNQGQWEEQIVREVTLPDALASHWAMAPIYGCPEYVVRGIYRRHRGWYDGNPGHLSFSPGADIAAEVVALAGGSETLLNRAELLLKNGNEQLALHLIDFAIATPDKKNLPRAIALKVQALQMRIEEETSYIGKSILLSGIQQLQAMISQQD